MARGHPLRGVVFHSSAMILSKFTMLSRWYRVGSSGCSLNKITLAPRFRLPLLRRNVVGFLGSTCDVVPTSYGFVRVAVFGESLRLYAIDLHNLRHFSLALFGNDVSWLGIVYLLD